MAAEGEQGAIHPGFKWGPFTFRVPFLHTRVEWPELVQGIFVAGATGLGLVPVLMGFFGLTFEEAVAFAFLQSVLLSSQPILFGEPFAPGWVTPALPLVLGAMIIGGAPLYEDPADMWRFMAALTINFAAIIFFMGITGLGGRVVQALPNAFKGGIIMGAAIAAIYRVFFNDPTLFQAMPVSTTVSVAFCILLTFSIPVVKLKQKYKGLALFASLGLLPGFFAAGLVGPFAGYLAPPVEWLVGKGWLKETWSGYFHQEVVYSFVIEGANTPYGILFPPFMSLWEKISPLSIGFPDLSMIISAIPLAIIGYVLLFGDLITGSEIIKISQPARPDEKLDVNLNRTHLSIGIRNAISLIVAPFFPTQGTLWTGVQVIIAQRWAEGKGGMQSFFSGTASYYVFGIPLLYMCAPLLAGLEPLMPIALSLTLVLTGFACAYVAMGLQRTNAERGAVIIIGSAIAFFSNPWIGMIVAVLTTIGLIGFSDPDPEEHHVSTDD